MLICPKALQQAHVTFFDRCVAHASSFRTSVFQMQLLHFFSRSRCKLDRLDIDGYDFGEAGLFECLKHDSCTSLVDLRMSSDTPMLTDAILVALTDAPSAGDGVLLPRLAHLTLEGALGGSPGRLPVAPHPMPQERSAPEFGCWLPHTTQRTGHNPP